MISGSLRTPALLAAVVLPGALMAQTTLTPPTSRGPGSITLFTQGPAPQSLTVSGGPAVTTIDWRAVGGAPTIRAMFYSLQRWKASDLTCCTVQWGRADDTLAL